MHGFDANESVTHELAKFVIISDDLMTALVKNNEYLIVKEIIALIIVPNFKAFNNQSFPNFVKEIFKWDHLSSSRVKHAYTYDIL